MTKKTTQHTPGPWQVEKQRTGMECPVVMIAGLTAATVYNVTRNTRENDANARLMAAAPEMLEALKGLLAGPNWPGAQMTARAAIAKAEGRAE